MGTGSRGCRLHAGQCRRVQVYSLGAGLSQWMGGRMRVEGEWLRNVANLLSEQVICQHGWPQGFSLMAEAKTRALQRLWSGAIECGERSLCRIILNPTDASSVVTISSSIPSQSIAASNRRNGRNTSRLHFGQTGSLLDVGQDNPAFELVCGREYFWNIYTESDMDEPGECDDFLMRTRICWKETFVSRSPRANTSPSLPVIKN